MQLEPLLEELVGGHTLTRAVLSGPRRKTEEISKVIVRPVALREGLRYQFTYQALDRSRSENLAPEEAHAHLAELLRDRFKQGLLHSPEADFQVLGGEKVLKRPPTRPEAELEHDRRKVRVLEEGVPNPFLIELGVMDESGAVHPRARDKFRQVNRFLELVADIVPHLPRDRPLRVVDVACGKSYLSFALFHYLRDVEGFDVREVGIDVKSDVVARCADLAARLGYQQLLFEVAAAAEFELEQPVDLVVSLHACDTATDDALERAVRWDAGVVLAAPCCQHELYGQLHSEPLRPLLEHGIVRERVAALATDAVRAQILELLGYRTQIVEFVETEHTPKNLLIRAVKRDRRPDAAAARSYLDFKQSLGVDPYLERALADRLEPVLSEPTR
ncbi:MAG: SAM-dependent methyltransferase [Actinomycetota bacterium]|nr:SAM-dependent methyltransferase [Actinomycetota bacterium]